jgi:hypothetical protein
VFGVRRGRPDSRSGDVPSVLHAGGDAQVHGAEPGEGARASAPVPGREPRGDSGPEACPPGAGEGGLTRVASTLSAPVPCASTVAATVPASGLRATMIGSDAGLRAVPQPCHWRPCSVVGSSDARVPARGAVELCGSLPFQPFAVPAFSAPPTSSTRSRGTPSILSISNPARRTDRPMRSTVRVPAKHSRCPPGLRTRRHSSHTAGGGTNPSQARPMKPFWSGTCSRSPEHHAVMAATIVVGLCSASP